MNNTYPVRSAARPAVRRPVIDSVAVRRPLMGNVPSRPQPALRHTTGRTATTATPAGAPQPTAAPAKPALQQHKKQFTPPPRKGRLWQRLQVPLIVISASIVGLFIQTEAVGIAAVAIYSVIAVAFRIPSRVTFALAAISIGAVALLLLFRPDLELAGNFTTYTFLLLVTGVIALIIEGRPLKRRKRGRPGMAR